MPPGHGQAYPPWLQAENPFTHSPVPLAPPSREGCSMSYYVPNYTHTLPYYKHNYNSLPMPLPCQETRDCGCPCVNPAPAPYMVVPSCRHDEPPQAMMELKNSDYTAKESTRISSIASLRIRAKEHEMSFGQLVNRN